MVQPHVHTTAHNANVWQPDTMNTAPTEGPSEGCVRLHIYIITHFEATSILAQGTEVSTLIQINKHEAGHKALYCTVVHHIYVNAGLMPSIPTSSSDSY